MGLVPRLPRHAWLVLNCDLVSALGSGITMPFFVICEAQRSSAFALRHATMNASLGSGAIVSVAIVDFASTRSFELLYLVDAATFLAVVPLLALLRGVGDRVEPDAPVRDGYRGVLGDRTFLAVWGITALLVVVGYAQYEAALPPFATTTGGVSAHGLGFVFAANTFAVAILQLFVLRLLNGRRRTTALFAASLAIGCAWAIAIAAAHVGGGAKAIVGFACAMVVLALAETLLSPSLGPIVNDLAPEHLRGRYNGAFVLAFTTGFTIGPAMAGGGLKLGDGTLYFAFLIVGCVAAMLGLAALRRRLPASLDMIADHREKAPTLQPEVA